MFDSILALDSYRFTVVAILLVFMMLLLGREVLNLVKERIKQTPPPAPQAQTDSGADSLLMKYLDQRFKELQGQIDRVSQEVKEVRSESQNNFREVYRVIRGLGKGHPESDPSVRTDGVPE